MGSIAILTLGNISFNIDELPEQINLGGEQVLAVRQFPGGGMDVQALGAFDDVIQWDGTFMFVGALQRCLALDNLRQQGQSVQLQMRTLKRTVIIQKFTFNYQNEYYIPYHIELQPLTSYTSNVTVNGLPNPSTTTVTVVNSGSSPVAAVSAPKPQPKPQVIYIVKKNDTLWGIAVKYYKNGAKWPTIANANGIKNPRTLQIGKRLIIP